MSLADSSSTQAVAEGLLSATGISGVSIEERGDHPALAWRRAGLAHITGYPDGPPRVCPAPLTRVADGFLLALRAMAPDPARLPASGAVLLGERARIMGLGRQGRTAPNGSCRLLDLVDGSMAFNLPRDDDWALVPALLDGELANGWAEFEQALAGRRVAEIAARADELGMAYAVAGAPIPQPWFLAREGGPCRKAAMPRVLDLSALWAGPLAASLLAMMGADVVKLEDPARPDGARGGHAAFYDLLNADKAAVAFTFRDSGSRLAECVASADIVITSARPRAFRQLGIDVDAEIARGAIWVAITGHGQAQGQRIGFGDDAAVAGGLAHVMAQGWGEPLMAGDALADPLTGLAAALAGWAAWKKGQGMLLDLALARTVAHALTVLPLADDIHEWQALAAADSEPLYPLRSPVRKAPRIGEDSETWGWRC